MKPGKRICSQLKEIRRSIAAENEIPYHERECTYEGPCRGTCPYCEAELRHLTQQLQQRILSGKAATVAGIAVSLASLTACGSAESPEPAAIEADTVVIRAGADSALPPDTVATEGLVRQPATGKEKSGAAFIVPPFYTGELAVEDSRKDGKNDCQGVKNETDLDVGGIDDERLDMFEEDQAEFPGGLESLDAYIQRNIRYPQEAREQHISGKVYVTFVVEKDGRVSNVKVLRDIGGGCGQEAVRVVEAMPKWKPAMRQGRPVRSQFNLPVQFILEVSEGEIEDKVEPVFVQYDEDPAFPGGLGAMNAYLQQHVLYPQEAREQHISGKVYVTFVVEKDGRVSNVKLLRDIGGGCGQEAVRVVKSMPRWTPGKVKGEVVRTQFNLPIQFTLED